MRRYLRYKENEPFDLTQILRTQFALDDAQYFTNLEVLPGRCRPADPRGTGEHSCRQEPAQPLLIRGGLRDRHRRAWHADLGEPQLNTLGHRFNVQIEASQVERYLLQSRYIIPIGDPAIENLTLQTTIQQLQLAGRDDAHRVHRTEHHQGGRKLAIRVVRECDEDHERNRARPDRGRLDHGPAPRARHRHRFGPERLSRASRFFQHPFFAEIRGSDRGDRLGFQLSAVTHAGGARVFPSARKWHLLLRDELGATLVSRFSQLPAVMRFFAGGDNSVRGFAYDELSPSQVVCKKDPVGGKTLPEPPTAPVCPRD